MLGDVNKLCVFKSLLTTTSNILPFHLKQTFQPIIWIFTYDKGDGIKFRLPFKIYSTLPKIHLGQTKSLWFFKKDFCFTQNKLLLIITFNLIIEDCRQKWVDIEATSSRKHFNKKGTTNHLKKELFPQKRSLIDRCFEHFWTLQQSWF